MFWELFPKLKTWKEITTNILSTCANSIWWQLDFVANLTPEERAKILWWNTWSSLRDRCRNISTSNPKLKFNINK